MMALIHYRLFILAGIILISLTTEVSILPMGPHQLIRSKTLNLFFPGYYKSLFFPHSSYRQLGTRFTAFFNPQFDGNYTFYMTNSNEGGVWFSQGTNISETSQNRYSLQFVCCSLVPRTHMYISELCYSGASVRQYVRMS